MRKEGSFRAHAKRILDDAIHAGRSLAAGHGDAVLAYERLRARVQSRTTLLQPTGRPGGYQTTVNAGLLALALHHRDWLRPAESWVPAATSPRRQFAELAHHLLARYPVPACMTSVWFDL